LQKRLAKNFWLRKRKILLEEKKLEGEVFYFFYFGFFSPFFFFSTACIFSILCRVGGGLKYSFDSCFDFY